MASKSSASGINRTCKPVPMEDVQGDNRWMDMVSTLINNKQIKHPHKKEKSRTVGKVNF